MSPSNSEATSEDLWGQEGEGRSYGSSEAAERVKGVTSEGVKGVEGPIAPATATNSSNTSTPAVVSNHTADAAKAGFKLEAANLRLQSPASATARRVSMDQGLMSGCRNDRLLQEKKRRRWSLNAPNHITTNLPQVS